ncbi:MAG: hypothetical protein CW742_02460 [Methanoregula sp.]|nr:MAG: hypothetical protein CW742_02460 [Methanoregula sp.]
MPRYRELNIMNRVSNKDFEAESSLNSALSIFSDVFRPASCMQSTQTFGSGSQHKAPVIPEISHGLVCAFPGRTI